MRFQDLVTTSRQVGETGGRLEKIERLAELLRRLASGEIEIAVAFLSGSPRQGRIGVGPSLVWEAKSETAPAAAPALELGEVDEAFERIAQAGGAGSAAERASRLRDLLRRATGGEQDFLARLLVGELRQGALEGLVLEAVARAARVSGHAVRRAAMVSGELGPVARTALLEGESALTRFIVRIFQPVQPMLAQPAAGVEAALERLGEAALEYKLDGARIQVHKAGDEVRAFSRALRDVTGAVPEVVDAARRLPARELILDGEVLALRPDGAPQPFQVTMRRFGRRLDVEALRRELPLRPYFFDLLYLDGDVLVDEPQVRRFTTVAGMAPPELLVPRAVIARPEEAAGFLDLALRSGHEGVMAKALEAPYVAGSRGRSWLKIKLARTLDLVVLAAEWGHGRRRGWLSNLHLGARDPERGGFVMLGKTFKGLTDEMLAWQTQRFQEMEIARDPYTLYLRPEVVVEIAFNDLQESPHYPGGLALRFARVKAFRPDKRPEEADTLATVQEIFRQMTGKEPPPAR